MLDILDKYKVNPNILERLQKQARDQSDVDLNIFDPKLETKRLLMNKEKGFLVQRRREYYNDFEDCIRDYKNAKIKNLQKHTKVHLSDGDNGDSDSEYVDCPDSNDLKSQSTLSSKSMPHVPSGDFNEDFSQHLDFQRLEQKPAPMVEAEPTFKVDETKAQIQTPVKAQTQTPTKAQLNLKCDASQIELKHESSAKLTTHNNNHNQIIDTSCNVSQANNRKPDSKVSPKRKSIAIDVNVAVHVPSTSIGVEKVAVNQNAADKQSKSSEAVQLTPKKQIAVPKDEQTKRKSCKKKHEGADRDPTQRWS